MTLLELFPEFRAHPGLDLEQNSWLIAKAYGLCQGWRINLAISQDGLASGSSGSSADVSNQLDRAVLGKLRSLADVIVTSGRTARVEKYKSSKYAPIAIFTRTGDLDEVPAIQGQQFFTPLVLTADANRSRIEDSLLDVDVRFLPLGEESEQWPAAVAAALDHEGFQSPLLESGLGTLREFILAGEIDEICLTITRSANQPVSAREISSAWLQEHLGQTSAYQLANIFVSNGTVFVRWRRGSKAAN